MFGFGFGFGFKSYGSTNEGEILADAYKIRVLADGGTYENGTCLIAALNDLDKI